MKRIPLKLWILLLVQTLLIIIALFCTYQYATLICEIISIIILLYISSIDPQIIYKRKYGRLENFIYLFFYELKCDADINSYVLILNRY